MKILRLIFLHCLSVFLSISANSQIIIEEGENSIYSIEEQALVFIDSTNSMGINKIKELKFDFEKFSDKYRIVKPKTTYWLQVKVCNKKSETINWVFNFYDPDFNCIEFYDQNKLYVSGVDFPFTAKRFFHKNYVFPIQVKPSEERIYWVKMQSESGSTIKAHLTTIETHHTYAISEYYLLGLYYGVLLILVLYNLILFLHTKNKPYLFYVLYLFCAVLFSFNEDGLGFQFLWGGYPKINLILHIISPIFLQLSFLVFAISFLEIRNKQKQQSLLMYLFTLSFVMHLIQVFGWISTSFTFVFYLFPFIVLLYFTWQKVKKKQSDAIYFFIGNGFILASLVVYYLRLNNWIYSGIFEVYAFNFSVVIEALVLSMAVGNKIRNGIKEKQLTQEKLIVSLEEKELLSTKVKRELADKVQKRTVQLEEQKTSLEKTNMELLELKGKLYKMNEALDLANHKLTKEIQSFSRDKILNKEISFEAFQEIYKDQITCLNYLKELKNNKKMACSNCGSIVFKPKDKYIKICVKCKKIESATSNTIFHSLKFPLAKAFYLVYITNYNKNKFTLDQLSDLLELGRNTCWSFTKKVEEKKQALCKGDKNHQVSFEELIL